MLINIVNEIRERRKRPTLIKFLQIYQKQSHLPNAKEEFQKKFKMLYGEDIESEDKKFDELNRTYDRVQKTISQQHRALDFLVKKVNKLIEQKQKNDRRRKHSHFISPDQAEQMKTKPRPSGRTTNQPSRIRSPNVEPARHEIAASERSYATGELEQKHLDKIREELENKYKSKGTEQDYITKKYLEQQNRKNVEDFDDKAFNLDKEE